MKSLNDLAFIFDSDKGSKKHNYCDIYELYFNKLRRKPINLLEIGISAGKSINMWLEYFPEGSIYGMDLGESYEVNSDRFTFIKGNQSVKAHLKKVIAKCSKFDIIIDDGSHYSEDQQIALAVLFPYLKKGGIYVIEDLGYKILHNTRFKKEALPTARVLNRFRRHGNFNATMPTKKEKAYLEETIETCSLHCENEIGFLIKRA